MKKQWYKAIAAAMAAMVALSPGWTVFAADPAGAASGQETEISVSADGEEQENVSAVTAGDTGTSETQAVSGAGGSGTQAVSAGSSDTGTGNVSNAASSGTVQEQAAEAGSSSSSAETAQAPVMSKRSVKKAAVQTYSISAYKPAGSSAPQTKVSGKGGMTIKGITFIPGSEGDAVMFSSGGKNLLMDTYITRSYSSLKSWLVNNGYTTFDIYLSHYHDDHMGNIENLLNDSTFHISTIYLPDPSYINYKSNDTNAAKGHMGKYFPLCKSMFQTIKNKGTKVVYLKKGSSFAVGNASFNVLWGCGYNTSEHGVHYINNNSLVTRITCGNVRYLTCGDIEDATEKQILNAGVDVSADIYKMSHHGGNTSNTKAFISRVNPIFAFFSGDSASSKVMNPTNSWTYTPVQDMMKIANVYSTKFNGEVDISVENGLIKASCAKNYVTRTMGFKNKKTGNVTNVTYKLSKDSTPEHLPDRLYTLSNMAKPSSGASGNSSSGASASKQGFVTENGNRYYYVSGKKQTGFFTAGTTDKEGKLWYYADSSGKVLTGWQKIGSSWYYLSPGDGHVYRNWGGIGGKTYRFSNSGDPGKGDYGKMVTGWQEVGKNTYYFGSDGAMYTGKRQIDGKWYTFSQEGSLQSSASSGSGTTKSVKNGWSQNRYYVNGKAVSGWYKVKGKWMYFDPDTKIRRTGWQTISGKKYYLDKYGVMVTGRQKIGGKWYTFNSDGSLKTNTKAVSTASKSVKNGWSQNRFYVNGKAVSGWYKVKGKQMYFNPKTKVRVTGRQKINGKWYTFDKYGVLKK